MVEFLLAKISGLIFIRKIPKDPYEVLKCGNEKRNDMHPLKDERQNLALTGVFAIGKTTFKEKLG